MPAFCRVAARPLLLAALALGGPGLVTAACGGAASNTPAARTVSGLCNRCHDAPRAGTIAPARWSEVRGVHRGRVQLDDDQWLAIEEYLTRGR